MKKITICETAKFLFIIFDFALDKNKSYVII